MYSGKCHGLFIRTCLARQEFINSMPKIKNIWIASQVFHSVCEWALGSHVPACLEAPPALSIYRRTECGDPGSAGGHACGHGRHCGAPCEPHALRSLSFTRHSGTPGQLINSKSGRDHIVLARRPAWSWRRIDSAADSQQRLGIGRKPGGA